MRCLLLLLVQPFCRQPYLADSRFAGMIGTTLGTGPGLVIIAGQFTAESTPEVFDLPHWRTESQDGDLRNPQLYETQGLSYLIHQVNENKVLVTIRVRMGCGYVNRSDILATDLAHPLRAWVVVSVVLFGAMPLAAQS